MYMNIMTGKITLFILIFFLCGVFLFAESEGENLTIKIAVVGPGDAVYFWWGHIALIVEDAQTGRSDFYDYGIFSFENENFYYNFAFGRLLYSSGVSGTGENIEYAVDRNRSVVIYTLDLPPETRVKVKDFVEHNVLPENSDYFYHHFRDNCSTRIRDIIDYAVDGQLKEQYANTQGKFTLRQHVRRHTWFSPAVDWILNFWMGQVIDTPITIWDDMFLPSEVGKVIQDFWYTDANGEKRRLVSDDPSSINIINTAKGRPEVLKEPRKQWPYEFVFSLVLSAIFCLFFFMHSKKIRAGKILAGFSMSLCALVFGLAGFLLYFMSIFTNHDYTFENFNMLFASPLLIAAVPLGISYAVTKKKEKQVLYDFLLRLIWLLSVTGILLSMIIKVFPWFYQDNITDQLLMLPIALVFTFQPVGLRAVIDKYFRGRKKSSGSSKKKSSRSSRKKSSDTLKQNSLNSSQQSLSGSSQKNSSGSPRKKSKKKKKRK